MSIDAREFESLEADFDVFDIRVDGIPVWERIRFGVFQEIQRQNGVGQAHTRLEEGIADQLKGFAKWLQNWVHRNPFLARSADVMFVGHPRRKKESDGLWWDIYCDPIHEVCELDSVHFEHPHLLGHRQPAKTGGIRYLNLIDHGGYLLRKLGLFRVTIPPEVTARLDEIGEAIAKRFDADVDLQGRTVEKLRVRKSTLWLYELLLERVNPKLVVVVVGYVRQTLVEACHRNGIPVVELQHGVIHRNHFGYHFAGNPPVELFPDYLLTWGEYWTDCVDYPIEDDRIIPVGYPYLDVERGKFSDVEERDHVLFISQGAIGPDFSKFAVEFSELQPDYEIVYKLHPGEYDRWEREYPWLADTDLTVVDDESVPLYRLFAESAVQVGVFSTAILEGLGFDLETYLVDLPGVDALSYLYDNGYATVVDSPEELQDRIGGESGVTNVDTEPLFASDALSTTVETIQELVARSGDGAVPTNGDSAHPDGPG